MEQRVLIADPVAEEGLQLLADENIAYDVRPGLKEAELAEAVKGYDAAVCRSGVKFTATVLAEPGRLKAIARAGVGVDNIDLDAATSRGVLVMNTAAASTLSTAEHALALMFSLARRIPQADVHVRSGGWKRGQFKGTQLAGKTLGVVGLGRIGRTVAERAIAMEMTVLGFDPFFPGDTAMEGRVRMIKDFDTFLKQLDIITFHVPGGDGTKHLLNRQRLNEVAKPTLLVVNDARGEVVDEFALAEAIKAGRIAGAAIDVFASEPPAKDHPLFALENVVLTPHLGASTDEAQQAVAVEACRAIAAYLKRGEIMGAVNAAGIKLDLPPDEAPFAELASKAGRLLAGYADFGPKNITLRASGLRASKHRETFLRLAAVEMLRPALEPPVNVININHLAEGRGIELASVHEPQPPSGLAGDILGVRVTAADGRSHRILGTCYADAKPRVLRIDDFNMDMVPEGHMLLIENEDQPGVIGQVGNAMGDAGVNIADMVISRARNESGSFSALMVLKVDSAVPDDVLNALRSQSNVRRVSAVKVS